MAAISRKAEESFDWWTYLFLYEQALELCGQHDGLVEERKSASCKCANACLKLRLYNEAVTYAEECLRLNPNSHKVISLTLGHSK